MWHMLNIKCHSNFVLWAVVPPAVSRYCSSKSIKDRRTFRYYRFSCYFWPFPGYNSICLCWKNSAIKPYDAMGAKEEEPVSIVVSWMNTQRYIPLAYRLSSLLPPPPKKMYFHISSWYQFIFVNFSLENFILHIFSHNYYNYSMFRDVPECSGMFWDVPCSWFYRRPWSIAAWTLNPFSGFLICSSRNSCVIPF